MAKMTSIYVGVSGLHSAQTALNTTTHNLANVYTPGYTRQLSFTADKTYNTIGQSYTSAMQVGLGVSTVETSRVRDILLDKSYRTENGRQGFYAAEYEVALEIQTIIGETEGVRFQQTLEDVWSSINEMAKTPDSIVSRSELVMNAELFIDRAKNIYTELIDYQKNIDTKVVNIVNKINSLGDEINALNLKISGIEAPELEDANDLRDRRDLLLDELSGLVKINYNEDENSYVSVMVEGVPFITDGGVFHMGIQELDGDKGSVYSTCVWPYLDNQEVFHLEEPITTDNKNDIGNIKGYLLARGDFIGSYKDVPEVSDYDVSTPDGYNEYMEAVAIYNKTVECCSIVKTQALFDKLIHNVVTAINDVLSPTTDEVPAGVTQYTDANGNVYNASDVKILDMTTSTGNDGKMPPEELFSRKYTDRYVEVTGDDGNTYYHSTNPTSYKYVVVSKDFEYPELAWKIISVLFDHARYEDKKGAVEIEEYDKNAVDPTARPLVINVDYRNALERCYNNIKAVFDGKKDIDNLNELEKSYTEQCMKYVENGEEATIEQWAAYTSRMSACSLISKKSVVEVKAMFFDDTETMEKLWWRLKELESETYLQIITGKLNIDAFDDFMKEWKQNGGETITEEIRKELNNKEK